MYAYIKGIIKDIEVNYVVLDNNGIGYYIIVPDSSFYNLNDKVTIFLHQHIREDQNILYGFHNKESKNMFLDLISVRGIGPKTAINILSTNEVSLIVDAIKNGDIKYLTKFPGIGIKTAQQIILDLKGKLVVKSKNSNSKTLNNETFEVLKSLGFNNTEIKNSLENIDYDLSTEQQVKLALKNINS